ncbi:MAG: SbmA/BacA-like family transporter, partial [Paracoccaceae bacterium]
MMAVLGRFRRLILICAGGPGGWKGIALYLVVLALELSSVWITLQLIAWSADFFDALEQMNAKEAVAQIGVFGALVGLSASRFIIADYLRKRLLISWRGVLTDAALTRWMADKTFWRLRPGVSPDSIDNPDQRIAEDCRLFVAGLLKESLDLIAAVVGLFSYVALLWALSSFPLAFTVFGVGVEIPRYMVWAAFIYVAIGSLITHGLGRPLKSILYAQEAREADFRYTLTRLRDTSTEVALSGGEPAERRVFDARFGAIVGNWRRLIRREVIVGLFTRPYFQTVLRVPLFLALPAYFAGAITLGGLMQLASAFSNVTTTLSWFIFSYRDLADLVATTERLDGLFRATQAPRPSPDAPRDIARRPSSGGGLSLSGLRLATPQGDWMQAGPDIEVAAGEAVWVRGGSGAGKSTHFAAIAGLWRYGEGRIGVPAGRVAFLPQRPYLPNGGLAAAAAYPSDPEDFQRDEIEEALSAVGLGARLRFLGTGEEISVDGLSGGE